MEARRPAVAAAVLVAVVVLVVVGVVAVVGSRSEPVAAAGDPPPATAEVRRGTLSAMVSLRGTVTFRARPDGSPFVIVNRAPGTYTDLPGVGTEVGCGEALHRVDERPVLLLCGAVPAYRDLRRGDVGVDVRQLNANLHALGSDAAAGVAVDPAADGFTEQTQRALEQLQATSGAVVDGELGIAEAVFLPGAVRIAEVVGELGGPASPGTVVLGATSTTVEVQVALAGSQQGTVQPGDPVIVTLPSTTSLTGKVDRLGAIAPAVTGPGGAEPGPATAPAWIRLDDPAPAPAQGFDRAPVQVEITTDGVADALSVPVTAIVGKAGGGLAVEVVHDDGRRELVAVDIGLVDATAGQVQVSGDVREGDRVVVPTP